MTTSTELLFKAVDGCRSSGRFFVPSIGPAAKTPVLIRSATLDIYPNAQTRFMSVNPLDYQYQTIGHMGWFKKSHQNLWPVLLKLVES